MRGGGRGVSKRGGVRGEEAREGWEEERTGRGRGGGGEGISRDRSSRGISIASLAGGMGSGRVARARGRGFRLGSGFGAAMVSSSRGFARRTSMSGASSMARPSRRSNPAVVPGRSASQFRAGGGRPAARKWSCAGRRPFARRMSSPPLNSSRWPLTTGGSDGGAAIARGRHAFRRATRSDAARRRGFSLTFLSDLIGR